MRHHRIDRSEPRDPRAVVGSAHQVGWAILDECLEVQTIIFEEDIQGWASIAVRTVPALPPDDERVLRVTMQWVRAGTKVVHAR